MHLERKSKMDRRAFIGHAGVCAAALAEAVPQLLAADAQPIAFNTANLVARVSGYHYELRNWGDQHKKTIAATDAAAWRSICEEIAKTGFKAVEIWEAHAAPGALDEAKAREWKKILEGAGLKPVAYAGELNLETARICQWLQIPHIDGGLGNLNPKKATALCKSTGIRFNIENHPEKSADELLKKIGRGNKWLGICVDMGWLGTQGVSGPDVIRSCGKFVRHTHVKDVRAVGKHESCALGEGVAKVAECLQTLRSIGYKGAYSWEDEPEDRNPFDSAARNLRWIQQHVQA